MHIDRKVRLVRILFLVTGVGMTVLLILLALDENLDFFYSPQAVVSGDAPQNRRIRIGGMVMSGSIRRDENSLDVEFLLGDLRDAQVLVRYSGILPDLFREGQGAVAIGMLQGGGEFRAEQILARHDENYMPPEVADVLEDASRAALGRRLADATE